jgi:hypothetical protein
MSIVKLNNNGVKNATAFGSAVTSLGSMTFIKKLTASSSGTLSFVDGSSGVTLDNSYKEYLFTFNNIHPATNFTHLSFQANAVGGSGYNETITSTMFVANHKEDDSATNLAYEGDGDLAQGTGFQSIIHAIGNGNDECGSGYLHIFNPSSTTFVKHFIANTNTYTDDDRSQNNFSAGYINTTSAIDEIQFKMSSGNIDAGDICLYGIA